ncbi:hypothetical protein ACLI38_10675 [Pseudomonas aeruginosa]
MIDFWLAASLLLLAALAFLLIPLLLGRPAHAGDCLFYTSPCPPDVDESRMPSYA